MRQLDLAGLPEARPPLPSERGLTSVREAERSCMRTTFIADDSHGTVFVRHSQQWESIHAQCTAVEPYSEPIHCSGELRCTQAQTRAILQLAQRGWGGMKWTEGYTLLHWAAKTGRAEWCAGLRSREDLWAEE